MRHWSQIWIYKYRNPKILKYTKGWLCFRVHISITCVLVCVCDTDLYVPELQVWPKGNNRIRQSRTALSKIRRPAVSITWRPRVDAAAAASNFHTFLQVKVTTTAAKRYLSFPVDPNDTSGGLVWGGDKNGLSADPVHVDAGSSFQVVQVNVAVFGDEKDDVLLWADLDGTTEKERQFFEQSNWQNICELVSRSLAVSSKQRRKTITRLTGFW